MIRKIRQQRNKKNELILSIMYLNVEKEINFKINISRIQWNRWKINWLMKNKYIVIIIIKKLSNLIFLLIVLNIKIK